jgi:hypothetical protein
MITILDSIFLIRFQIFLVSPNSDNLLISSIFLSSEDDEDFFDAENANDFSSEAGDNSPTTDRPVETPGQEMGNETTVLGRFVPGQFVPGRFVPGRFVPGRFVPGRFVPGRFVPGRFVPGRFVPGHFVPGQFVPRA